MSAASIVIFASHGVPALRTVLHGIRDTVAEPCELVVFAPDCPEQVATYLLRQYLRGRIAAYQVEPNDHRGHHCGLDRISHLASGEFLVSVDDSLEFQPGWLDKAIGALEADPGIGCLTLVQPPGYHRKRGRPATVNVKPEACASMDMRCYVTRRELAARHECEHRDEQVGDACAYQEFLERSGFHLAYLPGLVKALAPPDAARAGGAAAHEAELPSHEGASGALQRLEQAYELGDDVLLTCMACGGTELEVLAARIIFCEAHGVAIGFWYELRCPECSELHYKDDLQFRCPS
jgi:hypothetical protein